MSDLDSTAVTNFVKPVTDMGKDLASKYPDVDIQKNIQLGTQLAAGTIDPMQGEVGGLLMQAKSMFPMARNIEELAKAAGESTLSEAHPVSQAIQQALLKFRGYAEGGSVGAAMPPAASPLDSPAISEFLSASPGRSPAQAQQPMDSAPSSLLDDPKVNSYLADELKQQKYGSGLEQAKAGLEGLGQGLVGPLAPMAERALGVDPEDIRGRAEVNPGTHLAGEVAGLAGPALMTGGASTLTQSGVLHAAEKGLEKLGLVAGESLASKIGTAAAKTAVDNMLLAGSDEASKMVLNDPHQSAETALLSVGLSGVIGAGLGGALGSVSPLWEKASATKASQFIEDFKSSMNRQIENPNPVGSMAKELGDIHQSLKEVPVFGETGIKAQAIKNAIPELNGKMLGQSDELIDKMENLVSNKLSKDPNVGLLQNELDSYKLARQNSEDSNSLFNATQKLKQQLQEWGKYNKDMVPLAERPFRNAAKDVASDLREALEDQGVWGNAAKIQQKVNSSFSEFLPTLKDLEKTFFTKNSIGDMEINPGKIETYIKQLGSSKAEIKQSYVKNFLEQADKYKNAINDAYTSVGESSPFKSSSINTLVHSIGEQSLGDKVAKAFVEKGLSDAGSKAAAGAVGAALGSVFGHPELGAILGTFSLGPFFKSVLPGIAKAIVGGETNAAGLKTASDFVAHVVRGQKLLNDGAKGIFASGSEAIAGNFIPDNKKLDKLDEKMKGLQTNVAPILGANKSLQHYLPVHDMALTQSSSSAASYINGLRANMGKKAPLDSAPVISNQQKSAYRNALTIAEQPMTLFNKVKDGTITSVDIKSLQQMYPQIYTGMQKALMSELITRVDNGESIPYKTRIGLSMFLAQPLDSSMSPSSILLAQPKGVANQPNQGERAPASGHGVPSSPALQKMPTLFQTSDQARIQRSQKN